MLTFDIFPQEGPIAQSLDDMLLERCLSGHDEDAWEILVRKYTPIVWASIQRTFFSGHSHYSREDVEDVYSTVFLSLLEDDFRRLRLFERRNACALGTWLTIIGVRTTIDYLRKQKRNFFIDDDVDTAVAWGSIHDKSNAPEQPLVEKEMEAMLYKAVDALPTKDRVIFELVCLKEALPEEAAAITGLSVAAIYSRKTRILQKLRKTVKGLQENPRYPV